MSRHFDIEVYLDKGSDKPFRQARDKVPRRIGDNSLGAVFKGEVYPVYDCLNNGLGRIFLDDNPVSKHDCPADVATELYPVSFPNEIPRMWEWETDWYIESNDYGHYVVLNMLSRKCIKAIADHLEYSGFDVYRWAESHRPSDNGKYYQWFIRVSVLEAREDVKLTVEQYLALPKQLLPIGVTKRGSSVNDDADTSFLDLTPHDAQRLKFKVSEIGEQLSARGYLAEVSSRDFLNPTFFDSIQAFISDFDESQERLSFEIEFLQKKEDHYKTQIDHLNSDYNNQIKELKKSKQSPKISEEELLSNLIKDYEDKTILHQKEIAKRDKLIARLTKYKKNSKLLPHSEREEKKVCDILKSVFNNLAFEPDTPSIIARRFSKLESILVELSKLDRNIDIQLKKIQGSAGNKGWFKIDKHLNTGRDNRGRIYVRKSSAPDCKWDVNLFWKEDDSSQERFFRRLASTPHFTKKYPFAF